MGALAGYPFWTWIEHHGSPTGDKLSGTVSCDQNRALREAQPRILHALGTESVPAQPLLGRAANVREPQHTCTSTYMNYTYKATPMLLCLESVRLLPKSQNPSFTVHFFPSSSYTIILSAAHARATVNYVSQTGTRVTMQPSIHHIARPSRSSS